MERWVNILETNCDPAREDEFNAWCNTIHMQDILQTPGFKRARRYVHKEFRDGRGRYMHVYDVETEDFHLSMQRRRERREREFMQGRASRNRPNLSSPVWFDLGFRQIFVKEAPRNSTSSTGKWLNLVEHNIDPTREAEYHAWYNEMHIPDVLRTPAFVRATRYEIGAPRDGRGRFLTMYEIETDDIDAAMRLRLQRREEEIAAGRASATRNHLVRPLWRDVLWKQIFELSN
jgi:hypothetical protein